MTIYEIDSQITSLIDEETGEITDFEAFEQLQMNRESKIENLCCWYKDLIAEAKAIKEEKQNLADRQKVVENKAESVKNFISRVLEGEKFKTAKCAVSYRKSEKTVVTDEFIEWAKENADDLLTYKEPTANLTAVKEAIKAGRTIEFATIEDNQSMSVK